MADSPSTYQAAVVEHLVWARARSRMLEDVRREKPWNVDLTTGRLTIGDVDYDADILGTYASDDGTFLWAWENPGAVEWGPRSTESKASARWDATRDSASSGSAW